MEVHGDEEDAVRKTQATNVRHAPSVTPAHTAHGQEKPTVRKGTDRGYPKNHGKNPSTPESLPKSKSGRCGLTIEQGAVARRGGSADLITNRRPRLPTTNRRPHMRECRFI